MNGVNDSELDHSEFVETDPTGRYGRYNEILGKGSSKTVYKAFDEYEGIEVAWNQVKLNDFLQSPEDLERLYCEIHLLKTLKHKNIMKFYTSWVDTANRNINFVTEMFTSGTLRQYRLKHKRVNIRAVKHWCRQILKGLLYLHSHDPPVIHRDLKCDNIFINGNQGEVKIGDLGLAAILRKTHAAKCVGTPEFMAPEVYEEQYNELVDIYSFGMCILEMVTFEYPYSECTHPAQIYKKVISGKKPDALYKVKDPEVRQFVEKCLATVSHRLSAWELLNDPFLQIDDYVTDLRPVDNYENYEGMGPSLRQHLLRAPYTNGSLVNTQLSSSSFFNGCSSYVGCEQDNEGDCQAIDYEASEIDLFAGQDDDHEEDVDISIRGRRREDDGIFLRLRIADKEGRVRNIYFPFDTESDTALDVAMEMVAELDITDQDVNRIADMIDAEIASLVPEWKSGGGIEESPNDAKVLCQSCASNGTLVNHLSSNGPRKKGLQVLHCSHHGCGDVHGRFEEITYQFDGFEQCATESGPAHSGQSDTRHYTDIWGQYERPKINMEIPCNDHAGDNHEPFDQSASANDEGITNADKENSPSIGNSSHVNSTGTHDIAKDYENEIRQELRWLKAKYQIQLTELTDQQLGVVLMSSSLTPNNNEEMVDRLPSVQNISKEEKDEMLLRSFASGKHFTAYFPADFAKKLANRNFRNYEAAYNSCSPEHMVTAKSFYSGTLLPHALNRATSLPVDVIDY